MAPNMTSAVDEPECKARNNLNNEHERWLANPPPGEELVITGLSGSYPESRNVYEFRDNLFTKTNMVTSDNRRYYTDDPEAPQAGGRLYDIDKFDPGYFGVPARHVFSLDPLLRITLEKAVEAVIDAGVHPSELSGSRTGVFIGACNSDTEPGYFTDESVFKKLCIGNIGILRSMIARMISHHLKLNGPSYIVDTACSSTMNALEHAFRAIRLGKCDNAIVGGCSLTLHPSSTIQFYRLGVLNEDGACKVFDERADGYTRSEGIGCLLLQKSKIARRAYCQVVYGRINCDGFKPEGITFPSSQMQQQLLEECCANSGMHPNQLTYMEAHGTGTQVGDPQEVNAIDNAIAKKRNSPLLLGSVKSNIGHSEGSSAFSQITKIVIAMETGLIPPNINFTTLRRCIEGLIKGRFKVVTEKTPFNDDKALMAANSFGFGGNNSHVILRRFAKKKMNNGQPKDNLPRLLCVSGRVEKSITLILDDVKNRSLDAEYVRMLHQIFAKQFEEHRFRGYSILSKNGEFKRSTRTYFNQTPLVLAFGEILNIFDVIGKALIDLPPFATSICRINNVLKKKNIDINQILFNKSNGILETILGSVAVQIALADLLKLLELTPKVIFAHSIGEFACAYYNGLLNLEQTLLSTLELGNIMNKADENRSFKEACNGSRKLLLEKLNLIIKPNRENLQWSNNNSKKQETINGEYFVNALCADLNGTSRKIPHKAVMLEIGNGILIQNLGNVARENSKLIDSFNLHQEFSLISFLEIIGQLFELGQVPQTHKLYPEVNFPVSWGTPMISPNIRWQHEESWHVFKYQLVSSKRTDKFLIALKQSQWAFVSGHVIDGRNLFPATGYLFLTWLSVGPYNCNVVFEDCRFIRACTISNEEELSLAVRIQKSGSGAFEILNLNEKTCLVTGRVFLPQDISQHQLNTPLPESETDKLPLKRKDIYKELRLRGYNYKGEFTGLHQFNRDLNTGLIEWKDNWISFMDNMLQTDILREDTRLLYVPVYIKKLVLDPAKHFNTVKLLGEEPLVPVITSKETHVIRSGGVEIHGLIASSIPKKKTATEPVLEKYQFVPNQIQLPLDVALRVNMQIIVENLMERNIRSLELIDTFTNINCQPLSPLINDILSDLPLIQPDTVISSKMEIDAGHIKVEDRKLAAGSEYLLVIASNLFERLNLLKEALSSIRSDGYIITRENIKFQPTDIQDIKIVTVYTTEEEKLILLTKTSQAKKYSLIDLSESNFNWIEDLKKKLQAAPGNIIAYSQNQPLSGVIGFVNCLRKEPTCEKVQCFFIVDKAPKFDVTNPFYKNQIEKHLAINVFANGQWGTYRHLLLENMKQIKSEHCYVNVTTRGDLSSLKWIEGPLSSDINNSQALVHIYQAALNFRDIMTATGRINADVITRNRLEQECVQGFEYCGRKTNGERVMGMINNGALATLLLSDPELCWTVPSQWSMEEAATIPVVYCTVIYALLMRNKLKPKSKILIHSGTGGIGLAAINVAMHYKCDIFVTVGTPEKREFLRKHYPLIPESHIGNSRDTSFEQMIKKETNGSGVDIVLNSLAEEKLKASVRCLAQGGKFIEIGKFDLANNNGLELLLFKKEASFHGVMLDQLFNETSEVKQLLTKYFQNGINEGYVKPLPRTVFKKDEIEKAFRFMASGKHIGKVLIKIRDEESVEVIKPTKMLSEGVPRFFCKPNKSYIIAGGLGGFGLELADWLVLRGAKYLVLTSRRGIQTGYQNYRIKTWQSYGVSVQISTADITTKEGCLQLIQDSSKQCNIGGIFNLAVVLRDALFYNQTEQDYVASFGPKAYASKYLDELSRQHCPDLSCFVIFSSVSCGRGNAGQTNYGMANSVMERICEERRKNGYPALAIQWGAVGDVGLVADMQEEHKELEIGGTLQQKISNCLMVMDQFMRQDSAIVSSMVVAEKRGSGGSGSLVDQVQCILGIKDLKTISLQSTLSELGMDSMTGVEINQLLERDFQVLMTPQELRNLSFSRLIEIEKESAENSNTATEVVTEKKTKFGIEIITKFIVDKSTQNLPSIKIKSRLEEPEKAPKVFCIPGIDDNLKLLESLTKNMDVLAIGLQYDYKSDEHKTIQDIAESFASIIKSNLLKDEPFRILSHSFGVVIALEVVAILEKNGWNGKLFAVDGSPDMCQKLLKNTLDVESSQTMQNSFLLYIAASFFHKGDELSKISEKILGMNNFDDKLQYFCDIEAFKENSDLLNKQALINVYQRLEMFIGYKYSQEKIKSSVKLYKPKTPTVHNIEDDFKLSEICTQSVKLAEFEGDHQTILKNIELAEDINRILSAVENGQ